jgi:hypothetical protein
VDFIVKDRRSWEEFARPRLTDTSLYRRRIDFEGYRKQKAEYGKQNLFFVWTAVNVFESMHPVCGHEHMLIGMALSITPIPHPASRGNACLRWRCDMGKRPLGMSGVEVSAIALGCRPMGGTSWGGTDDAASIRTVHRPLEAGISFIDTAPGYGSGHSEEVRCSGTWRWAPARW